MTIIAIIILTIGHMAGAFFWQFLIDQADKHGTIDEPAVSIIWLWGFIIIFVSWAVSIAWVAA